MKYRIKLILMRGIALDYRLRNSDNLEIALSRFEPAVSEFMSHPEEVIHIRSDVRPDNFPLYLPDLPDLPTPRPVIRLDLFLGWRGDIAADFSNV